MYVIVEREPTYGLIIHVAAIRRSLCHTFCAGLLRFAYLFLFYRRVAATSKNDRKAPRRMAFTTRILYRFALYLPRNTTYSGGSDGNKEIHGADFAASALTRMGFVPGLVASRGS